MGASPGHLGHSEANEWSGTTGLHLIRSLPVRVQRVDISPNYIDFIVYVLNTNHTRLAASMKVLILGATGMSPILVLSYFKALLHA
jgi:hypothetical protein